MSSSLDRLVIAAYRGRPAAEILAAPPDALRGVSAADATRLREAFGMRTVRALASSPQFRRALAVLAAAGSPGYDPGPPPVWEAFFRTAPHGLYRARPDLFRLDFGPVYYRGRLDGTARVVVVGQDPASDEILAQRVLVGTSGQRVQGLLARLGLTRSYVLLNTFLYSVHGQYGAALAALSRDGPVLAWRNGWLDRLLAACPVQAVVAVGRAAREAVQAWPASDGLQVVAVSHPAAPDATATLRSWNRGLDTLRALVEPDDGAAADPTPYGSDWSAADHQPIPRQDLPFGLPDWHGQGDRSRRSGAKAIVWNAP